MEILDKESYTPMIQQYLDIKKGYKDSIVFFRLGDFYEMFFDDAILAAKVLEIALTGKDAGVSERVPMCGIPYHAYQSYATKLLNAGYKVVIVEQIEDPSIAKGIVKRGVVKILTPGTIDAEFLNNSNNNYLAAINKIKKMYVISYADISTGECYLTIASNEEKLLQDLENIHVKEIVIKSDCNLYLRDILEKNNYILSVCDDTSIPIYLEHLCDSILPIYKSTIAILFNYAINTQKSELKHFKKVEFYEEKDYLKLDYFTIKNLELTETIRGESKIGSLFNILNNTSTASGARMLKKWLLRPLIDINKITERQNYILALMDDYILKEDLKKALSGVYDLERIIGKLACNSINAKDLVWLRNTLLNVPKIKNLLLNSNNELLQKLALDINIHEDLATKLKNALVDNPPLTIKEGGMFKEGYNNTLDELLNISKNAKDWLNKYETEEKERLNVKTLKVGFNKVFGYYIEISKGQSFNLGDIEGYTRKQTLVNAERYITKPLKEFEDNILNAKDKIVNLEYELFNELKNYVRPTFNSKEITIINGRHPVLESILKDKYVPNDVYINDYDLLLLTGPNMGGKSTYMKMLAIIIIMAQMGSLVPSSKCELKIFDEIFTRIGASDDLVGGESTFMIEMKEANFAISNATNNSLILFDEIGRGTATYDGMALAQAIIEYIHQKVKAVTVFSTHYHELTLMRLKKMIR